MLPQLLFNSTRTTAGILSVQRYFSKTSSSRLSLSFETAPKRARVYAKAQKNNVYPNIISVFNNPKFPKPKGLSSDTFTHLKILNQSKDISRHLFVLKVKRFNHKTQIRPNVFLPGISGLTIICSKKSFGKYSYVRNAARRKFRNAYQLLAPEYSVLGLYYTVILKPSILQGKWNEVCDQLKNALIQSKSFL
ncbi:hypothetical protein BB561_004834 [Smittium simulii]|uniref:Uncharacterized protein n=1 Tax=Smittium simulii TaxID=133385 RepID=A0A2T9YDW8_9FUNG|nr:hypothetical protein BB561_004834 [Smittium simulii]